jgi:hypothetical protein
MTNKLSGSSCLLWCSALLLLSATLAGQPNDGPRIEGFVTADVSAAIPGVSVGLDSLTRTIHRQVLTDNSGYYLLDNLPAGTYTMFAEAKGYGCIIYPRVAVNEGEHVRRDFRFLKVVRPGEGCEPVDRKAPGR